MSPMAEGEALEVDVGALHDAAKFLAGRYSDHDGWVVAIRAAASALTAAQQPVQEGGGARLTSPWTGEPRDYRDVNSDPAGTLCVEPGAPLKAAPPSAPVGDRREIERVIRELRAYNPAADEHRGAHIHGVWAKELERALTQQPAQAAPGDARAIIEEFVQCAGVGRSPGKLIAQAREEELRADRDSWAQQASDRAADWHAEHQRAERLEEALRWYAEQAAACRKLGRDGDIGRQALDADGGKRARAALSTNAATQTGETT